MLHDVWTFRLPDVLRQRTGLSDRFVLCLAASVAASFSDFHPIQLSTRLQLCTGEEGNDILLSSCTPSTERCDE